MNKLTTGHVYLHYKIYFMTICKQGYNVAPFGTILFLSLLLDRCEVIYVIRSENYVDDTLDEDMVLTWMLINSKAISIRQYTSF